MPLRIRREKEGNNRNNNNYNKNLVVDGGRGPLIR